MLGLAIGEEDLEQLNQIVCAGDVLIQALADAVLIKNGAFRGSER